MNTSASLVLWVDGLLTPTAVDVLRDRLHALVAADPGRVVVCDVTALTEPDAGDLDGLASLQLAARRLDVTVRLRGAGPALRRLVALCGLTEVLLPVETDGQAEQREQAFGVEELVHPDDPPT